MNSSVAHQANTNSSGASAKVTAAASVVKSQGASSAIVSKMRQLEKDLLIGDNVSENATSVERGMIEVNGPVPADFSERFQQAVGMATGVDPNKVKVVDLPPAEGGILRLTFEAPSNIVHSIEGQAADPSSQFANSPLHDFLIERDTETMADGPAVAVGPMAGQDYGSASASRSQVSLDLKSAPVQDAGIDVDTEMPYGELEPFGREDTAQELTEQSVKQSDEMVDQLERAEVSEEKRATFRALTRLRGAAITSFDGVARAQTGNIDEYSKMHKWRMTHPLHHLADEESDIAKWAFPDNAD